MVAPCTNPDATDLISQAPFTHEDPRDDELCVRPNQFKLARRKNCAPPPSPSFSAQCPGHWQRSQRATRARQSPSRPLGDGTFRLRAAAGSTSLTYGKRASSDSCELPKSSTPDKGVPMWWIRQAVERYRQQRSAALVHVVPGQSNTDRRRRPVRQNHRDRRFRRRNLGGGDADNVVEPVSRLDAVGPRLTPPTRTP